MRNMREARAIPRNDTPTESARAGIDAEDDDLSFTCPGLRRRWPASAAQSREFFVGDVEVGEDVLHVVVIVERFGEVQRRLPRRGP